MRRATILACALLAATLGPESNAAAQTSGTFSGSVPAASATTEPVALTLRDAVERGLEHNLAMIALEQQVESARGARVRSLRDLLPRIETRAGETRQTTNLAAFGFDSSLFPGIPPIVGPFTIFDARVYGAQPLVDLSAKNDVRSKTASLSAARLDQENARDLVVYVVTNLYLQAAAGRSRIETARSQVATAEALLTQATNLRNAGVAPGIDVVRAQVQLQVQRQRVIAAETDQAKGLLQLVRAIGLKTSQRVQLTDAPDGALPQAPASVDAAIAQAARTRADYKASLERIHAAEFALKSARATALPSIRVMADYGAIGSNPGDARRTYSMSANVRVPLFDQDRVGREVENAAALRQREAESADLAERVEAEVRSAFLDVQAAEQQVAVARERVALADQELSLARIRFTAGVTNNLEVIQAQNEVASAADAEVSATLGLNVARAALARAIGGSAGP
jgi:outer membrane protein TolC